jgi:hypothetical protein
MTNVNGSMAISERRELKGPPIYVTKALLGSTTTSELGAVREEPVIP